LAAACGGYGSTEPAGPPAQLEKSEGDGQNWYFGNALPVAYEVVVRDANGRGVSGVTVTWSVTAGGGSVDPATSVTNADGVATTTHTLGPAATSHSVTANAAGLPQVEFTASATSPPTSAAVSVGDPTFFSPENVVVQVGGTVTWTWGPSVITLHNVVYVGGPTPLPAGSQTQTSGTHSNTFTNAGLYQYACTLHSGMDGTVRVVN
jgi:plastocyanin